MPATIMVTVGVSKISSAEKDKMSKSCRDGAECGDQASNKMGKGCDCGACMEQLPPPSAAAAAVGKPEWLLGDPGLSPPIA